MAAGDESPFVRLHLASGLQRLPVRERWPVAESLLRHGEDAEDLNLSLLTWYGIEPLVLQEPERAVALLAKAQVPLVREYVARRLADPDRLVGVLAGKTDAGVQRDVLRGLLAALEGWREARAPDGWSAAYARLARSPDPEVRGRALTLAALFGNRQARGSLYRTILDPRAPTAERQDALLTLLSVRDPALLPRLRDLIEDRALRGAALRGLAAYADEETPELILRHYPSFTAAEKTDAVLTLASRPAYAHALLTALEQGRVARRDVSAFTARQLLALKDPDINARLARVWGTVRPALQDKARLLVKYKALLTADALAKADPSRGRAVFKQTCASCHRLFDDGGDVGPDLTGSQRANLDYVLENVLDPSAVVAKEYQVTVIETKDGRVLTGIIRQENDRAVTVQTQNEKVTVPKREIQSRTASPVSMMPEGMFRKLTNDEVRDLLAYLAARHQVPLPNGAAGGR
jgi:putative heme-binding domain-containing protein